MNPITVTVVDPDSGRIFNGPVPLSGVMTPVKTAMPMTIGIAIDPEKYGTWLPRLAPGLPGFARVFAKPGVGLPDLDGRAIRELPNGCLPWISHKVPVPLGDVRVYWDKMAEIYQPPPGRRFRWTYFHEAAPLLDDGRRRYLDYLGQLHTVAEAYPWIEVVQIQSNYAMRWRADTRWDAWLLPEIAVGFDCYSPMFGLGAPYEPPASMFGLLQHAAREFHAPAWYVPELGADPRSRASIPALPSGSTRAAWLGECLHYLQQAGCAAVGLWCKDAYAPSDPETLAVFKAALNHEEIA
jgi:hypothetical protein